MKHTFDLVQRGMILLVAALLLSPTMKAEDWQTRELPPIKPRVYCDENRLTSAIIFFEFVCPPPIDLLQLAEMQDELIEACRARRLTYAQLVQWEEEILAYLNKWCVEKEPTKIISPSME